MRKILLLILLLLPSTALAQARYDVSCENVAQISIIKIEDTYWNVESYQGHFHLLDLILTPEAAREALKLRDATPREHIRYRGEDYYKPRIVITAHGVPLQDDVPALSGFMMQGAAIIIIHEEDAFDAARAVCPALVRKRCSSTDKWNSGTNGIAKRWKCRAGAIPPKEHKPQQQTRQALARPLGPNIRVCRFTDALTMRKLVFLILLLLPGAAFAQPSYDLSCENVSKIIIVKVKDTHWNVDSYQGHFHVLDLTLTPEAAREAVKLRDATPREHIRYRGEDYYKPHILITVQGIPLQKDVPALSGIADHGAVITIIREEDAFDAARAVCPALVPEKVLIDGQVE